ncbi:hypothetical protein MWMV2_MWMV2_03661 [Acinetobacter oleivorans]|nr:hypothetical protein MWMV5_MWMV5_03662 [Acinetobacter oleivorans]CAI3119631.1 hypothetical protein MWMV13_MWMV13_03663 [Acinetobacter oleivorans]CAI3119723.1 hypothetical protein MWMV2_MWMV2_03661 [Acinetobacter oleivorans]CAI3120032.1 hypothetical protein MWMV12_MWMV12_03685 [Acinetobacter oleivorans]CAI3120041.1 hypothetical protein MWMV3_MWMV3_03723 [Acinetobacter oleivorans]
MTKKSKQEKKNPILIAIKNIVKKLGKKDKKDDDTIYPLR